MAFSPVADHYSILGLPRNATKQEIEAAWRRAVKEWHPDRNRSAQAKARLQQINTARNVLADDRTRRRYDREQGFLAPDQGQHKMERPVKSREQTDASSSTPAEGKSHRPRGSTTNRSEPPRSASGETRSAGTEWSTRFADVARRNAEAEKNEAIRAAAERDREQVTTLLEQRPLLTRYVLMPAGAAAILIAAIVTVILV